MRSTWLAWLVIVLVAVSGCIQTVPSDTDTGTGDGDGDGNGDGDGDGNGDDSPKLTLNRHLEAKVTGDELDNGSFASLFSTVFVVGVHRESVAAADLTIKYTNKQGTEVTRPLTELTNKATLLPGDVVRVEDANLTSTASLMEKGTEVLTRAAPATTWWNVGGEPIGFTMEPGAGLSYDFASRVSENVSVANVDLEDETIRLDLIELLLAATSDTTLVIDHATGTTTVQAEASHTARPLAWSVTGDMTLDLLAALMGRNLTSEEAIEAGFRVADTSAVTYDAHGAIWVDTTGRLVRADLAGGNATWDADVFAWATPTSEFADADFSCVGKTRAENCRPTEVPEENLTGSKTLPANSTDLDGLNGWPPAVHAALNAFLGEDLRPGDRVRFVVDLDAQDLEGDDPSNTDDDCLQCTFHLALDLLVNDPEQVTVAGGTFDALKITERAEFKLTTGEQKNETGVVVLKPLVLEDRIAESTIWLAEDTFVPLRVDRTMPLDVDALVDTFITAIEPAGWEDLDMEPVLPDDLDLVVDATWSLELARHTGETRMAPWVALALVSSTASSGFGGAFAGAFAEGYFGDLGIPGFGDSDEEMPWEWPAYEMSLQQTGTLTTDAAAAQAECGTPDATSCVTFEVLAVDEGMAGDGLSINYVDDWWVTPECLVNGAEADDTPLAVGDVLSCYTYDEYLPESGGVWEFWYDYAAIATEMVVT